ncbi:Cell division protein FtsL, partial [Haemophilus influenzae]
MSENNKPRYPLQQILVEDLFSSNKLVVLLLIGILVSAMGTIWITHKTRQLISENG